MSEHLTTTAGAPVPDNQNSVTAGPRGPVLPQDQWWWVGYRLLTASLFTANQGMPR